MARYRTTCRFFMRLPGRYACKEPLVSSVTDPPRDLDLGCPAGCADYQRRPWLSPEAEDEDPGAPQPLPGAAPQKGVS